MSTPKTTEIKVAAAASLKNGLNDIIAAFEGSTGNTVDVNVCYDGSYTLANDIVDKNVPYDVYLSASDENDLKGMKKVKCAGKTASTPVQFIANDLVLVKNKAWVDYNQSPSLPSISKFDDVTDIVLGSAHIWVADPTKAPAGDYAADAFGSNWLAILTKAINDGTVGDDVQKTLAGLIADPVPAVGVVYRSDYKNPPSVPLSNTCFVNYAPLSVNQIIIYSAAVLINATGTVLTAAQSFVDSLGVNNPLLLSKYFRLTDPSEAHKPGDPI